MKQRVCQGCGKPLVKPRPNQQYHDTRCKQAAYRAKSKAAATPSPSAPPLVVLAGVDTLYVNAYYADRDLFTRIDRPLDEALQVVFTALQQQAKSRGQTVETPWTLDEQPLHMLSHGSGKQWQWILHNDLVNMQMSQGGYRGLLARVRISSEYLWRVNALQCVLGTINGFVNALFAHEILLVPSAIDLCADIANWPMASLNPLAVVARARKQHPRFEEESLYVPGEETWNGRTLGTLYIGMRKSPIHGKLYDKLKEIKDGGNKKSWFLDLYQRNGWIGDGPVTRLEVSFSREALNDLGIETLFDLIHNLKNLWSYAVGSETVKPWLRYTVPTTDSNNRRWPLHPTWSVVQHAFDTLSELPARDLIRWKKQQVNMDAFTASLAGYLSSRTVYQCDRDGTPVETYPLDVALVDAYEAMTKRFEEQGITFQDLLQVKQHRYYMREQRTREVLEQRGLLVFGSEHEITEEVL